MFGADRKFCPSESLVIWISGLSTHLLQYPSQSFSRLVKLWVHPDHSDQVQNLWDHGWNVLGFGVRQLIARVFQYHQKLQVTLCLTWALLFSNNKYLQWQADPVFFCIFFYSGDGDRLRGRGFQPRNRPAQTHPSFFNSKLFYFCVEF